MSYIEKKRKLYRSLRRKIETNDPAVLAQELNKLYSDLRQRLALLKSKSVRI